MASATSERVITASMSASYHMLRDAGGAGSCGDCENRNGSKECIGMTGCNDQPNNRGEHREQHHVRLHEREKSG